MSTRGRPQQTAGEKTRRVLLAKVHIARKQLGLEEGDYRDILAARYRRTSAAELSIWQLEDLVRWFREKGWTPRPRPETAARRLQRLRARIKEEAFGDGRVPGISSAALRLRGLCRSICKVDSVEWCKDPEALSRLLAALARLRREELRNGAGHGGP
jgi:phage gp16-like protein